MEHEHPESTMVTDRYAHILDDDRKLNAERFEREFYSGQHGEENEQMELSPEVIQLATLLMNSPDLRNLLKSTIN